MSEIYKLDAYHGAMVGVLAGDAAGAPYENMKSEKILADIKHRGGLELFDYTEPFKGTRQVPAGHPTDDSELTAALAMSLCESRGFDPKAVYRHLRGFIFGNDESGRKSILTNGSAYGSGGTLRSALRAKTYEESFVEFREGRARVLPSNGALMRTVSVALMTMDDEDGVVDIARRQSCVTHIHPLSQVACIVYSLMLASLVSGYSVIDAWKGARVSASGLLQENLSTPDKMLADAYRQVIAINIHEPPSESKIWPHTGDVLLSLRIAVWGAVNAKDFVDGLTRVIGLGGDVDTYGAIAGGLLGAHFGIQGIPLSWRKTLIGHDTMISLADRLFEIAHS